MATTITSANSSFTLNVPGVSPVPIPIQGYAADDAFDTENVAPNEVKMGVDGQLSGGYTPYPVKLKFVLQANSASILFMDLWRQTMDAATEAYPASATIIAPSIGKVWNFKNGFLTGAMPIAPGKKTLSPQTYEITFNAFTAAAIPVPTP